MRRNRAFGCELRELDVVFVDDARQDLAIMRSILTNARLGRVRGFSNAAEARHAMMLEPPHVLITDYEMPEIDGLALVRSMRDSRAGPLAFVPAVVVTGRPTAGLVEGAISAGVHHVVAKPLAPAAVLRRLESIVRDARGFVLDEPSGRYVLEDGVERLMEQRKRRVGHMAKLEAIAAAEARAAAPQPVEPPDAKRSGRLHGLGAPKHAVRRVSAEGATGQSLGRTA